MSAIIGYWGQGQRDELAGQFNKILSTIHPLPKHYQHSFAEQGTQMGVAWWGDNVRTKTDDQKIEVALSASGLKTETDVTIRARLEGLEFSCDSFGRVPLYWLQQEKVIWFSNQVQLLLPLVENAEISIAGLHGYACLSYVPTPHTPLKKVFAVPAGTARKFQFVNDSGRADSPPRLEISWSKLDYKWQEAPLKIDKEFKAVAQLQKLLTESINAQLTDAPSTTVGVFLSGGLDSAVTAALLVRAGIKVRAYTLDFGDYGVSEIPYAERVAKYLDIPLVKVSATPNRIKEALPATVKALDMPFGDGVTVPLYLLYQAANKECSVVFNGEGGDQLFAGWTNKPLLAADVYQPASPTTTGFHQDYLRTFHRLHGSESLVYEPEILEKVQALDPLNWLGDALDDVFTPSLLHRLRRANLMLKGAQNIQPRATNLAFANKLSVRTPFCYHALAKWTFQLNGASFLRESHEKYLLKKAVELWLPGEIVWREKRGMGVPLTAWCTGPLWDEVGKWLQPAMLKDEGIWQPDLALRISTGNLSGQIQGRRIGETLWLLLMWQAWRVTVLQAELKKSFYSPFLLPPGFWRWKMKSA